MKKQEIRTFGRTRGKKLSARQNLLMEKLLPKILPGTIKSGKNLILEIGFGSGEYLRRLATENPNCIIIGAETFINGIASLLSAITDKKTNKILPEYKNIRIFPGDVRNFLHETTLSFNQIWILYPDPWPKARHEKRRLLNSNFLNLLSEKLSKKGQIIIGTDHFEYFDWIINQVKKTCFNMIIPDMKMVETRYQRKNLAKTSGPRYLILTK